MKFFSQLCRCGSAARMEKEKDTIFIVSFSLGAGDEARTRYLHLGKVALYQMSYTCKRQMLL